ncbi:ATP-binding protein [Nocardioides sp.]|uniref:ATP-binding protein n=1 Tax=Nocardioides sp. TaxID=35761 RepID=UPI00286C89DA|nr:ATP-binding protein [Nocardioides sp.]
MTEISGVRSHVRSFVLWWTAFAVLVILGRLTAADASSVGLVAPAAGVALLWLMSQETTRGAVLCLAAMAVTRGVLSTVSGAAPGVTVALVVAGFVQTLLMVTLLRRWCPGLLGAGGSVSVHEPGVLVRGSAAVLVATGVGAVIGTSVLMGLDAPAQGLVLLDWWARNLAGVFLVGAVGHLAWEWVRESRSRGRWVLVPRSRVPELVGLLAISVAAYGAVFLQSELPLSFLPLIIGVWSATRFPTFVAALHSACFGALALVATLAGRGPFGALGAVETQALVTQAYILTQLLTVLALATGRDERVSLVRELRDSQQETAARAELLDAMTESMSEGLVVVDRQGTLVRTNTAARALLESSATGYQESARDYQVLRTDGTELSADEHPSMRALREGAVPAHDVVLRRGDGSERVLSVTASALTGGGSGAATAAMVVYRDVTDERSHSNRLTEFAEVVAHDLRSPLTVMHGWLDVALGGLDPAVEGGEVCVQGQPSLVRRAMERALVATVRMEELISDLLLQATAAGGRMEPVACTLGGDDGLLTEVAGEAGASASVCVGPIPPVLVDVDLVRQLVSNLIGNALKYVAPDTVPRVVVSGTRSGDRVLLEMTDNGIGVPDQQREAIFDRFHRAHTEDTSYVGTGLGLAICRTIVERHGGEIVCRSATDGRSGGTTFAFDLPAA